IRIDDAPTRSNGSQPRFVPSRNSISEFGNYLMETVFIQIKAPRGRDPGRVLEGHYNVVGDTVVLWHFPWSGSQWWPTDRSRWREAASIGRVKPYHRASSLRCLSSSAVLISPLARRRLSTSSAVARPSPPDVQSAIQTIMAAKPTKTSS